MHKIGPKQNNYSRLYTVIINRVKLSGYITILHFVCNAFICFVWFLYVAIIHLSPNYRLVSLMEARSVLCEGQIECISI